MRKKNFKAESKRLLDLMINSIYTNRDIFLREIISNASDAVDKLHYISLTDESVREKATEFGIFITVDKENRTVTVSDSGIGMDEKELEENLGTIAKSGSLAFKSELENTEDADIIGQFGVGFYSAFMVAEKVTVVTRKYNSDVALKWVSEGCDGYTIEECQKDTLGTDIIMQIKPDTDEDKFSQYLDTYTIQGLIKQYSDYIRYPIKMEIETTKNVASEGEEAKYEKVKEIKTLNSMVPIWARPKSEVSDEDCAEYYKSKFMDFSDPLLTIRQNADGLVSYKAMLFVPSKVPYGYFTKDFEKGLQLYSSGVLIMDRCEQLLPDHFRFVKGVVDTADLSLNISRELLQNDRQLKVIAGGIEKKIKSELKKLMENEPEKYAEFWKNFGIQIKYGVVSDYGIYKDAVMDLLVFRSSNGESLTTLKDYVSRMPEEQQFIYYLSGESAEKIAQLPQAELCRDKGYEILYLTDDVDEFVVSGIGKFEEKEFKSVDAEDSGLVSEDEKKALEETRETNKDLCEFVKTAIGDDISSCVISEKLKSKPVFLSTTGPVTLEMEKYFSLMPDDGNPKPKAEKVLELNPDHAIFKVLKTAFETDKPKAEKIAKVLNCNARLIAGLPIDNAVEFCDIVAEILVDTKD
ncbi:MAG: molecular chaperone HtpG [Clostridia bacterium]|nr:molecular chaperone HtpG [Clostridia bacterium]